MASIHSVLILAVTALVQQAAGSALRDDKFCENLSIIGGETVTIDKVPYMAALLDKDPSGQDVAKCGGSLVNKKFVLTAASCISSDRPTKHILVGSDKVNGPNGHIIRVEKIICHEHFDLKTLKNDICLLKLEFDVPLGRDVGLVSLYAQDDARIGLFNITGWGITKPSGINIRVENELHQTTVPYVSKTCCTKMIKGKFEVHDTQICAGSYDHDFCLGDSGSPLVYKDVQVGIASFGSECGSSPSVYTKVASYRKWIDETIAQNQ